MAEPERDDARLLDDLIDMTDAETSAMLERHGLDDSRLLSADELAAIRARGGLVLQTWTDGQWVATAAAPTTTICAMTMADAARLFAHADALTEQLQVVRMRLADSWIMEAACNKDLQDWEAVPGVDLSPNERSAFEYGYQRAWQRACKVAAGQLP
jgi:hypothetical protein